MINADMRLYNYFTLGAPDEYGQQQLTENPQGSIKIAINTTSTAIQDNVRYKDASYIGLTQAPIDDSYIIEYGAEKLKVLYVVPKGRYKQAFMKNL